MNIFVTDLHEYNKGNLIGEWVALPMENIAETLKSILTHGENEYFITDYENVPFRVEEYSNLRKLNEQAKQFEQLEPWEQQAFKWIAEGTGYEFAEVMEIIENGEYRFYEGADSMADVAHEIMDESGQLDAIPEPLRYYFDYEAYGRDLEIEGHFYRIAGVGYIEVTK